MSWGRASRRGQLTLWFDERAVAAWRDTMRSGEPGRPRVYANAAVECALILKSWRLPTLNLNTFNIDPEEHGSHQKAAIIASIFPEI